MIEQKKKAYICSPLFAETRKGITANILQAKEFIKNISKRMKWNIVAVHSVLPTLLDDYIPAERKMAMDFCIRYLSTCDLLVICGNRISSGMECEIAEALRLKMPIYLCEEKVTIPNGIPICVGKYEMVQLPVKDSKGNTLNVDKFLLYLKGMI